VKISLVNMPFSSLQIPSIALHQLSSVIDERFGNSAKTSVHYLNHDFGALVGLDTYAWISESLAGHTCGFGEWLFRSAAFPEHEDIRRFILIVMLITLDRSRFKGIKMILRPFVNGFLLFLMN